MRATTERRVTWLPLLLALVLTAARPEADKERRRAGPKLKKRKTSFGAGLPPPPTGAHTCARARCADGLAAALARE